MTLKQYTLGVIYVAVVCNLSGVSGTLAQDKADNTPRFDVKLVCPKHEIVAGENIEFQVVISNLSQRIRVAPPQSMLFLDLIVQKGGTNIPPQVKVMHDPLGDIEIEANSTMTIDEELGTWFPLGLYAGEFTLSMSYIPDRNNRQFAIMSNTIKITVKPRSPEQEKQYKAFLDILSSSGKEAIQKSTQFLATYSNSMFEARVRLELGARYLKDREYDSANRVLDEILTLPSATVFEQQEQHYFSARVMKAQGRLAEAIAEAEKASPLRIKHELQVWKVELRKRQGQPRDIDILQNPTNEGGTNSLPK